MTSSGGKAGKSKGGKESKAPPTKVGDFECDPSGGKEEYLNSSWFISSDNKVVVEAGDESEGSQKAIVWPISRFRFKTLKPTTRRKKHADVVHCSNEYYLNIKWYKKWKGSDLWDEHSLDHSRITGAKDAKAARGNLPPRFFISSFFFCRLFESSI